LSVRGRCVVLSSSDDPDLFDEGASGKRVAELVGPGQTVYVAVSGPRAKPFWRVTPPSSGCDPRKEVSHY